MTRWRSFGGSLFLKIFVWFWLAMTLVAAASTLVAVTHVRRQEGRRAHGEGGRPFSGAQAVEIWEREGRDAVVAFLKEQTGPKGGRTFLFRGRTDWASPWEPSPSTVEVAARALERGERIRRVEDGRLHVALPVAGPGGHRYAFVAERPRRSPLRRFLRLESLGERLTIMFVVASFVCYGMARYLTAPVKKLRNAAQALAEGDLTARVGPSLGRRRDEIADLGHDFDRMAKRIESLVEAQKRLLRDISHELRSPLARLNVALELARQKAGSEAVAPLDRIEREAERLNELIGQLLTLTQLESGGGKPESTVVALDQLVRQVAQDADFEARSGNRTVRVVESEMIFVVGAPELLRRSIENVVRNAVRFTAEGTEVEIRLNRAEGRSGPLAHIEVRDRGPGVPEEALPELFRPFYRMAESRDRRSGGTGIGLAITERAIRLHGGAVRAQNAPDGGLIISVELPATESRA